MKADTALRASLSGDGAVRAGVAASPPPRLQPEQIAMRWVKMVAAEIVLAKKWYVEENFGAAQIAHGDVARARSVAWL